MALCVDLDVCIRAVSRFYWWSDSQRPPLDTYFDCMMCHIINGIRSESSRVELLDKVSMSYDFLHKTGYI